MLLELSAKHIVLLSIHNACAAQLLQQRTVWPQISVSLRTPELDESQSMAPRTFELGHSVGGGAR